MTKKMKKQLARIEYSHGLRLLLISSESPRFRNVILITFISFVFLSVVVLLTAPGGLLQCYCVKWSNLTKIAPNVYVDSAMPARQREDLLSQISNAKECVTALYGEYSANPTIIAGHTMDVMNIYGGNQYNRTGRTYITPASSFVILGPNGIGDINILAHELAHVEFVKQIGYLNWKKVPNWFDEGLAIQFDNRYTEEEWQIRTNNGQTAPNVKQMSIITHDDWLGYATAKHEVSRWREVIGQEGFIEFLSMLKDGEIFSVAYHSIEDQYAK